MNRRPRGMRRIGIASSVPRIRAARGAFRRRSLPDSALTWCARFGWLRHKGAFQPRDCVDGGVISQSWCVIWPNESPITYRRSHPRALVRPGGRIYSRANLRLRDGELMDPRFIDDLARKLSAAVPQSVTNIRRDLEENFKAVLQATLSRMDLVTRQEFDVQAGVLRRTREKLEALEAKLAELEQKNVS